MKVCLDKDHITGEKHSMLLKQGGFFLCVFFNSMFVGFFLQRLKKQLFL